MIIDCHTHAWDRWPYEPAVPDPETRGAIEQLLFEMDRNDVDKAIIICARIDHNPHNNDYIATCAEKYPDRIVQFADVDCSWTESYHQPGAAERLEAAAAQYHLKGYTQYLADDFGWFETSEGQKFIEKTVELKLIASFAFMHTWHEPLRAVCRQYPDLVVMGHHLAGTRSREKPPYPNFQEVLKSAEVPNIYLKLSGFPYVSTSDWDFPFADAHWMVREIYKHYGAERLCWASDYPPVLWYMTYKQSLEVFRTHCSFVSEKDKGMILGENMGRLLENAGGVL